MWSFITLSDVLSERNSKLWNASDNVKTQHGVVEINGYKQLLFRVLKGDELCVILLLPLGGNGTTTSRPWLASEALGSQAASGRSRLWWKPLGGDCPLSCKTFRVLFSNVLPGSTVTWRQSVKYTDSTLFLRESWLSSWSSVGVMPSSLPECVYAESKSWWLRSVVKCYQHNRGMLAKW